MSHKQYKLLALDMDGTLLTEDKLISQENKAAIREAEDAGATVMFSTGRGIQNVLTYVEELQLKSPIVTVNGSEVWKAPGELLLRHRLDTGLLRRMHGLAVYYDTWFWAYSVGDVYNKERWISEPEIDGKEWLKFGFYTENEESLSAIRKELESWESLEITNSHPANLELNPKGISKASGLEQVCGLLGLTMAQVIAMGDSLNDVSMIRAAGLGVAMGNAQDEVKQLADVVTVSNEEHGVARIIREYLLG
ncbi:Cof-type HAD-IIB family hydrolase [Paenibacillus filicis]|uniref:Cof-type HAD-IIB family hydrolase n=1 Tax=Paenibacillus gyeongsangnamensis TaxID=3388067 RepID=A0ABT4QKU5_9BACL|nr:Cof-type HAD-IIB family hydrolase [Paenibacillus filicis]MCZ8517493.1 Cof-type HAD-IIB family hydrolase [Paenibacillus filicis]